MMKLKPREVKESDKDFSARRVNALGETQDQQLQTHTSNYYTTLNINVNKFLIKICELNKRITKTKWDSLMPHFVKLGFV